MALISQFLKEILRDPISGEPLEEDETRGVLRHAASGREFAVRDGIVMMLVENQRDESETQ